MIAVAPAPEFEPEWSPAIRDGLDLRSAYCVVTNDGCFEIWSGHLLHTRLRPEFVHGRPMQIARITEEMGDIG